jgi:uncharacterized membrane protein YkvA (DUF1232 family)
LSLLSTLKHRAKQLKAEAQVLILAYRDKRTPLTAKILIGITVGYLLSPIDLIPDFIPILGLLDDFIIVPVLIALSIKLIPPTVLNDAREQLKNNPQRYKKNNWLFAALIIIIWLSILYIIVFWIRGRMLISS